MLVISLDDKGAPVGCKEYVSRKVGGGLGYPSNERENPAGHKEYSMLDKIGSYGDSFTGGILIEANASLLEKLAEVLDIHRTKEKTHRSQRISHVG